MTTDEVRLMGRAKNAVLAYFENHLSIPKIYIDAEWDGHPVDVLAINRDGVGDVHVALLVPFDWPDEISFAIDNFSKAINPLLDKLESIQAQYKYVAVVDVSKQGKDPLPGLPHAITDRSFSPDGLGKVGFFAVFFTEQGPQTTVRFIAERFRAKIAKLADEYVQQHEADWEIRA